jgi:LPS export ABC transporter protein LptC
LDFRWEIFTGFVNQRLININLRMSRFENLKIRLKTVVCVFADHFCYANVQTYNVSKNLTGLCLAFIVLMSCEDGKKVVKKEEYKGPISEVYGINMTYSDSAKLVVRMTTDVQLTMVSEDKIFPKEIRVFFFDKLGNNTTKLRGDSARFIRTKNLYRIMGRVQIDNQVKHEVLETPELYWSPETKKIYTDKQVDIKTPDQVLHGVGMDSNQDFTDYTIRKVTGVVSVKSLPQ